MAVQVEPVRRRFTREEPEAADVLLLIEVAETSLAYDRTAKLRLYAEPRLPSASTGSWTPAAKPCTCVAHPGARATGKRSR